MSESPQADLGQHPIYQALNGISARLIDIQKQKMALREAEFETRAAIKLGLNTYFSACAELGVEPKHRIDMHDGFELVINEDWFDMDEMKAVTLQEAPKGIFTMIREIAGKEEGGK